MQFSILLINILCIFYVKGVPVLKENSNTFIVGDGSEVEEGEFPWQVSLRSSLNSLHFCGGVIIDHSTILTTAGCAELATPIATSVVAGNLNLNLTNDTATSQQIVKVSSVHIHPNYAETTDYSNDIAILKINSALQITENVAPIPLYDFDTVSEEFGIISGWGTKREEEISLQEKLQKATVKLLNSNQDCQDLIDNDIDLVVPVLVENSMLCIENPESNTTAPIDSCTGDQGGPLIIYVDEAPVLLGLISFGIGCGRPNMPSFCTRVSPFIDFIRRYQENTAHETSNEIV